MTGIVKTPIYQLKQYDIYFKVMYRFKFNSKAYRFVPYEEMLTMMHVLV